MNYLQLLSLIIVGGESGDLYYSEEKADVSAVRAQTYCSDIVARTENDQSSVDALLFNSMNIS